MEVSIEQGVEALIFASEQSISVEEIWDIVQKTLNRVVPIEDIALIIQDIQARYDRPEAPFALQKINGGYLFLTKEPYYPFIQQLQLHRSKKKLSQAALETLAIVAYRQPVTKLEIEQIRGVSCDYAIQKLLEKDLVSIVGKSTSVGKPLLYGTGNLFMEYFGLAHIGDLPKLKDIFSQENSIGETQE